MITLFFTAYFLMYPFLFLRESLYFSTDRMFIIFVIPLVWHLSVVSLGMFNIRTSSKTLFLFSFMTLLLTILLCFSSLNRFYFLLTLEFSILPVFLLMTFYSKSNDKVIAIKIILFFNLSCSLLFIFFSKLNLTRELEFILGFNSFYLFIAFILVLVRKIPIFFFHFWLTKAHVSAFRVCSIILARLIIKLGAFGLQKFYFYFLDCSFFFSRVMMSLLFGGIRFFFFFLIRSVDLKYFVARSSVYHISFIFPFLMLSFYSMHVRALIILVGHGLISFYLFYLVSIFYENGQRRSYEFIKSLEVCRKTLSFGFITFLILNLGVPPFIRFFREIYAGKSFIVYSLIFVWFFFFRTLGSIIFISLIRVKILRNRTKFLELKFDLDLIVFFIFFICTFFLRFIYS